MFLSSVLKNMDKAVFDTIDALADGTLTLGDDYLGTLANSGVGLGPFHNFDSKVSAELKAELEQVSQGHHRRQDRPQGDRLLRPIRSRSWQKPQPPSLPVSTKSGNG